MSYDFNFFWRAARAVLDGQSPYEVDGFFSPLPFAWAMIPFGLLPFDMAFLSWTILNVISLIALTKRNALRALLFLPIAFSLWVGQVDILIIAAGFLGGWLGLAFTALKPQLAIWIIPYTFGKWWYSGERKKILYTSLMILSLYIIPSVVWPKWWFEWLDSSPSIFTYSEHSSSLFGFAALINFPIQFTFFSTACLAILILIVLKPFSDEKFWNWMAIFNPVSNVYSLSIVVQYIDWIAIGASWMLLPVALNLHTGLPWIIVPGYLLVRNYMHRTNHSP